MATIRGTAIPHRRDATSIAGIGLFALRLTEDGYWTGHLVFSILPRS
jgi:hypothetical protein